MIRIVVLWLIRNLFEDVSGPVSDCLPVVALGGLTIAEKLDQISHGVVDRACIVEQIIGQLVDICNCAEVVNQDLVVLEATEVAGEGNWVDGLNNSSKSGAHLVI